MIPTHPHILFIVIHNHVALLLRTHNSGINKFSASKKGERGEQALARM